MDARIKGWMGRLKDGVRDGWTDAGIDCKDPSAKEKSKGNIAKTLKDVRFFASLCWC